MILNPVELDVVKHETHLSSEAAENDFKSQKNEVCTWNVKLMLSHDLEEHSGFRNQAQQEYLPSFGETRAIELVLNNYSTYGIKGVQSDPNCEHESIGSATEINTSLEGDSNDEINSTLSELTWRDQSFDERKEVVIENTIEWHQSIRHESKGETSDWLVDATKDGDDSVCASIIEACENCKYDDLYPPCDDVHSTFCDPYSFARSCFRSRSLHWNR